MLVVVVRDGDATCAVGDGVRDIRLSKKNGSGTDDWCMLLSLNPHAMFYTAPTKSTKAATIVFYCCYR